MTRKHFIAIAEVIRTQPTLTAEQREWLAKDMAYAIMVSDPKGNFDRQRFLDACEAK